MGLVKASILVLIVAISIPLLYQRYMDQGRVKQFTSYHPSFKIVDTFLRKSAKQLDTAVGYLPSRNELKDKIESALKFATSYVQTLSSPDQQAKAKVETTKKSAGKDSAPSSNPSQEASTKPSNTVRYCECEHENLKGQKIRLWSKEELSHFDGKSDEQKGIYLAFLGIVYDVSINRQHYAKDAEYNIFTGRDATRAFVTGNFSHDLHDNVADLDDSLYSHLESWMSFYQNTYPVVGRIEGSFYDFKGCGTRALNDVYERLRKLELARKQSENLRKELPECNSEWNSDTKKGKVWCSPKSGGIERDWSGVPRIFDDGQSKRCACFNQDLPGSGELVKFMTLYPGCDARATECILVQ